MIAGHHHWREVEELHRGTHAMIDSSTLLPTIVVGHAGPGSVWQAMVVVAAVALTLVAVAVATRKLLMEDARDLVVPATVTAGAASLGAVGHTWISDGIGWGLPLAIVASLALLVHVTTPWRLDGFSPLSGATLAIAVVSVVMLTQPLTIALHPPVEVLPLAGDATIQIVSPADNATIEASFELVVAVSGATIGPGADSFNAWAQTTSDPLELATVTVAVNGDRNPVTWESTCTVTAPCTQISGVLSLGAGPQAITVELVRGDGVPLAPAVVDRVRVVVP